MDKEIKEIISKIYVYHEENQATNEEIVNKMKNDLETMLSKIKGISVSISISHDPEYKRIEYGENCAVALDIFVYVPNNEHTMVVQISKLGKFAWLYWRISQKGGWYYYGQIPEGWPSGIYHEVCDAIQKYGLRVLEAKELDEPFEGVVKYIIGDNKEEPETVGGLLFCYDGPH